MSDICPEWFIGGPLHGQDKEVAYPKIPSYGIVRAVVHAKWAANGLDAGQDYFHGVNEAEYEWQYTRKRYVIGTITIYFWTDVRFIGNLEISSKLGELIMAPHVKRIPQICKCGDSVYSGRECPSRGQDGQHCPINKGQMTPEGKWLGKKNTLLCKCIDPDCTNEHYDRKAPQ